MDDIRGARQLAMHADAMLKVPVVRRRELLGQLGIPRHVYKYRGLGDGAIIESMLLDNTLWAATAKTLNDPFDAQAEYRVPEEGQVLRATVHQYFTGKGAPAEIADAIAMDEALSDSKALGASLTGNHQEMLEGLGMCALSADPRGQLLWSGYADKHQGIALQYRPSLDPMSFQVQQMEYSDTFPVIDNFFDVSGRDLLPALLRKGTSWSHEKEWRIFRPNEPDRVFNVLPESLTGVVMGLKISDADRDFVTGLVEERDRRFGLKTMLFQAVQAPGAYGVRLRRVR